MSLNASKLSPYRQKLQDELVEKTRETAFKNGVKMGVDVSRKEMQDQRKSQIELIRLHFAIANRENWPNYPIEQLLGYAWDDADAFIKKSEA